MNLGTYTDDDHLISMSTYHHSNIEIYLVANVTNYLYCPIVAGDS